VKVLEDVGRSTLGFFDYAGGIAELTADSGTSIASLRVRFGETVAQAYILGVQSTPIVLLTSLFIGMVISFESAQNAVSYGVSDLVGGAVAYTTARELGPMLTAVVVAGRAGAAMAAEIGSMVVTEQIEALKALGLSPTRMLVVPRLLALMVTLPILTILSDIVAISGGAFLARAQAHIPYDVFLQSVREFSSYEDFMKGLVKALVFAATIVLISCYQGLGTRGGAAGVGKATTGAVVNSIILIFAFNFILSIVLYIK
jgi:phospholipid/cholesterol/gamma-HCH transport system permease protein